MYGRINPRIATVARERTNTFRQPQIVAGEFTHCYCRMRACNIGAIAACTPIHTKQCSVAALRSDSNRVVQFEVNSPSLLSVAAKSNVVSAAALYMYARVAFNHMIAPVPILIVTDISVIRRMDTECANFGILTCG